MQDELKGLSGLEETSLERQPSICSLIAESQTCPLCQGPIEGSLASVEVSLVCVGCLLLDFKSETPVKGCYHTVSQSEAIKKSECRPLDLKKIKFLKTDKGYRRYLRGEVWFLRNLRRKEEAEKKLGFKMGSVHPLIRHYMFGDYLKGQMECTTKLEDIQAYKDVYSRATKIVRHCPSAHPQAVLDYCLRRPYTTVTEFSTMKEKVTKVFQLEGRRILHYLTADERRNLKDGPLGDVCRTFEAVKWEPLVVNYLKRWFHSDTVSAIMADGSWRNRDWATGSEDRVAVKLKAFWEEKVRRKAALKTALSEKRLPMPESCNNCEAYLNGSNDLSLQEIIGGVDLSTRLRRHAFGEDDNEWAAAFSTLFHCFNTLKLSHYPSVNMAMDRAMEVRQQNLESVNTQQNGDGD